MSEKRKDYPTAEKRFQEILDQLDRIKEPMVFIVDTFPETANTPRMAAAAYNTMAEEALNEIEQAVELATWGLQECGRKQNAPDPKASAKMGEDQGHPGEA